LKFKGTLCSHSPSIFFISKMDALLLKRFKKILGLCITTMQSRPVFTLQKKNILFESNCKSPMEKVVDHLDDIHTALNLGAHSVLFLGTHAMDEDVHGGLMLGHHRAG
jgi:hypothetical protein